MGSLSKQRTARMEQTGTICDPSNGVHGGAIARRGSWRTLGDFIGMLYSGPFLGLQGAT